MLIKLLYILIFVYKLSERDFDKEFYLEFMYFVILKNNSIVSRILMFRY